jgi:hypothetical protein
MTSWTLNNITKDQKLEIIFSYLFSNQKNFEEENFWNILSKNDLDKLEIIDREETCDFDLLKSRILWK